MLANQDVRTFPGDPTNIKITHQQDLIHARILAMSGKMKVGTGIDFHRLQSGRPLVLCGVNIPHSKGSVGHSDGDAGLHAVVDAILGACSAGDMGSHFSSEEDRWKGANSRQFLEHAVRIMESKGGSLSNVDVTIICQEPMISPYKEEMRSVISTIIGIDKDSVSVKATTTDHMGFLGREEGICATSSVAVVFK